VEWGKMRYNLLGNAGHWFPGEMVSKISDNGKLRLAISKNPFAAKIPEILRETHQLLFTEPKKRLSQS
jgi:predicted aldo/keto reductase-like oxidoreductase